MSLRTLEGWDGLVSITDKYFSYMDNQGSDISTAFPRTGLQCLRVGSTTDLLFIPIPHGGTPSNEIYLGFAFRTNVFPPSHTSFCRFYDTEFAGSLLSVNADGQLAVWGATQQEDSGAYELTLDTWHYIEVKMIKSSSSSAGDVIVKVDGVEWINCSSGKDYLGSGAAQTNCIAFRGAAGGYNYFDDVYICDETGAQCNTFLGQVKIATIYPDGNGNTSDFVGSDSNSVDNYLLVDDTTSDDDATYSESGTPTELDLYTYGAAPSDITVLGVQVNSYLRKDTTGDQHLARHITRVGGSNYEGPNLYPGFDYMYHADIWELNPNGDVVWTESTINGAEFGIKVQT